MVDRQLAVRGRWGVLCLEGSDTTTFLAPPLLKVLFPPVTDGTGPPRLEDGKDGDMLDL